MAAPCKRHVLNDATRSLHAWNECTGREYAKDVPERDDLVEVVHDRGAPFAALVRAVRIARGLAPAFAQHLRQPRARDVAHVLGVRDLKARAIGVSTRILG